MFYHQHSVVSWYHGLINNPNNSKYSCLFPFNEKIYRKLVMIPNLLRFISKDYKYVRKLKCNIIQITVLLNASKNFIRHHCTLKSFTYGENSNVGLSSNTCTLGIILCNIFELVFTLCHKCNKYNCLP